METLLSNITNNPNDVNKLKSFLYEKDNWTKDDINSLEIMYLGNEELKNFTGLCMEAYRVLENDPLKKLLESDKPYTYKEFDDAYYEFNNAMNFFVKNDIDPSKIKNGKINFSKAQEAYANLNNKLIGEFLDKLKDISDTMTVDEKNEVIHNNEEIRQQIGQLKSLFDLSNEVKLVAKLDYQVLGKMRQDKLRILKEKYSKSTIKSLEAAQKLSNKLTDSKKIYKSFVSSISGKKEALEAENKKIEHQMLDEEYKTMMVNNLTTDESINRFNEQLKEDAEKEKTIEKNNRKIIMYKAADKIATSPIALYNKMKNFIKTGYDKSKNTYINLNSKIEEIKNKYNEKIKTEEQIKELAEEEKSKKIKELDPSLSSSKLGDAIDDAFSIFDNTIRNLSKKNEQNKKVVKMVGNFQHLIRLPYDIVQKIKLSKKDHVEEKRVSM